MMHIHIWIINEWIISQLFFILSGGLTRFSISNFPRQIFSSSKGDAGN